MAANPAEWCADYFEFASYEQAPEGGVLLNPRGPGQGNSRHGFARTFKGFSRAPHTPDYLECIERHAQSPLQVAAISFRCVKPGCT